MVAALIHLPLMSAALLAGTSVRPRGSAAAYREHCFVVQVDLGTGSGIVQQKFTPLFSESELLTVRMPVPFELHAEAVHGVLRVSDSGYGLCVGDVLRACSTFRSNMAGTWFGLFPVRARLCRFPSPQATDSLLVGNPTL